MINNIEIANPIINGDITMEAIKRDLNSRMGQELLILSRRIWQNEVKYNHLQSVRVIGKTDDFIITQNKNKSKQCFSYRDFFCGDIIFEAVQDDRKR